MRLVPLIALAALLVLAGCGGEADPAATPAGRAQVRLTENLYDGHFSRAWNELHPAHQRVVSRAQFERCARKVIRVGDLESIEVLDVYDDDISISGLSERKAKAVRIRVTSFSGDSFTAVQHEVKVRGRWRWMLNSAAVRAYRRGACPTRAE